MAQTTVILEWDEGFDRGSKIVQFAHEDGVDVEAAMRAAVADYEKTNPTDLKEIVATYGGLNWGDITSHFPDEIWARHGLTKVEEPLHIRMDHDEWPLGFDLDQEEG